MKTYIQLFVYTMLFTGTGYADSRFGIESNSDLLDAAEPAKPEGDEKSDGSGEPDCD